MIKVNIRADRFTKNQRDLLKAHKFAVRGAVNDAAWYGMRKFPQAIHDTTGIRKGRIKEALERKKATTKTLKASVAINPYKRRVSARHFKPRQTQKGVKLHNFFKKNKLFPGAFIVKNVPAPREYLNGLVWQRMGERRLPVENLGNVVIAFDNLKRIDEETDESNQVLHKSYHERLDRKLNALAARRAAK